MMCKLKPIFTAFLVAFTVVAAGCGPTYLIGPAHYGISYEFGFVSEAEFDLSGVELYMDRGGQRVDIAPVGYLSAGGINRHGPSATGHFSTAPARVPDKVFVLWFDHRGNHEQVISLAGIVPDMGHFEGTIWFIFIGDRWRCVPLTKDQIQQRMIQGRGITPID